MPKDLVASDGAVAWSASHSAYGRIVSTYTDPDAQARYANNPVKSPFRLLGQVADEDAELCWTRFRCFDPETGTWISTDPLEIEGGWALYGLDGAPIDTVDPLGLTSEKHKPEAQKRAKGPGRIANDRGVEIIIHSNDHGPAHAHVISKGRNIRIGQNGKPLKGEGELTRKEQEIVDANKQEIRRRIRDTMKEHRRNNPKK